MRYALLSERELMRDATRADRAQISGRETVATQRNPPKLRGRTSVSSNDDGALWPAPTSGDVGGNFGRFVKSSWVHVTEESFSWPESFLQKTPPFGQQIGLTATRNFINMRGDCPNSLPRFPK